MDIFKMLKELIEYTESNDIVDETILQMDVRTNNLEFFHNNFNDIPEMLKAVSEGKYCAEHPYINFDMTNPIRVITYTENDYIKLVKEHSEYIKEKYKEYIK